MYLPLSGLYRFDQFELDPHKRALSRNGLPIPLSPKAFDVLSFLVVNPGRAITKDEILQAVWSGSYVEEGNLAQHISTLRKALADRAGCCITTLPGRGYQFTAAVQTEHAVHTLPDSRSGDVFVQTVRERTNYVIERVAQPPVPQPLALPAPRPRTRLWAAAALAAGVLLALAGRWAFIRFSHPPQVQKLVVSDFSNATGDAAFDRTLKRALEIDLEQSPWMDVLSGRDAVHVLQLMGRGDSTPITAEIAREICERTNRHVVLTGSIAPLGHEFLLTLEASDCTSGKKLAAAKAEAQSREKVLASLDSIADKVRRGLGESSQSVEDYQVPIVLSTTASLDALRSYSVGQSMDAQGKGETETLPFYQRAVELDPQFAMAWGAMANEYYNLGEFNQASQYYKKAFDLSDHVSAKEKLVLQAHYYAEGRSDLEQGIRIYKQWSEIYPNDWTPWVDLANEFTQIGDYAEAVAAGRRALELEPNRAINYSVLARAYLRLNRHEGARSVGREAVRRQKDSPGLHATLYVIAAADRDKDALARESQWAASCTDPWYKWFFIYLRAEAASSVGKEMDADSLFQQSWEAAQRANMTEDADDILVDQATIQLSLGLRDAAQATLRRTRNLDTSNPDFAVIRAKLGDAAPAEHFLAAHGPATAPGTQTVAMDLPRIRSALALLRGKPLDAVSALEPALPYDLATYAIPTQRAEAYLKGSQPEFAILEYNKILANPGIEAISALYPLAHLGMARAYALQRNTVNSRAEFNKFFDLFKAADPDLPILKQARIEYSHLK